MVFIDEIVGSLILLAPGFLALQLGLILYGSTNRVSAYDKSIYSLLVGASINAAIFLVTPFLSVADVAENPLILAQPIALSIYALSTVLAAIAVYGVLRADVAGKLNSLFWRGSERKRTLDEVWEKFLEPSEWIIVRSGGWRFYGYVVRFGVGDERRGLELQSKEMFAAGGDDKRYGYDERLYFPPGGIDSITRVTRIEEE